MQPTIEVSDFADLALTRYMSLQLQAPGRLLISVSGVPGSGKTTFANAVVHRINQISQLQHGVAVACALPMDGYHLSREDLASLPDPEEARRRRGAPFTFDADGLHRLLEQLREPPSSTLYAPSFDHAIKDPIPKNISILATQRIVIVEGNYLCFNPPDVPDGGKESTCTHPSPLWRKISALFDEKWVIDTPLEITSSRLALRHLAAGIVGSLEEGFERANGSDRENSNDILRWMGAYDRKISAFSV
ncbi:hypothetical protein TWF718_000960 [Orbilia javanica]|uniref:Uncharacterized protein n=1 Tax=Orbilia javanica TaxID=47235 RepID=A0AAN8NGV0_9PEZI